MRRQTNKFHCDLQHPPKERNRKMIHRICAKCGKMESVDFGVVLDDDFYCAECDLELNQKENNEKENDK